jgi:hypothetical protein
MLLEDMELLNEDKDNNKGSSDESYRKLKHKRKHIKISYDDDEEDENNMYIEKNKNYLDVSYIPQDLTIFANQVIAIGNKPAVVPDTISKETPSIIKNIFIEEMKHVNEEILNPNFINSFKPYVGKLKPLVNDNKEKPSTHKKFSLKYNTKPPKPDENIKWNPYNPGWENENNNNNNNINNDRNENNNNNNNI